MSKRQQALVLHGRQVKVRLHADAAEFGSHVHVDFLRFTMQTRNAPKPAAEVYLVGDEYDPAEFNYGANTKQYQLLRAYPYLDGLEAKEYPTAYSAYEVARQVTDILGPGFDVLPFLQPGKDFYKWRYSIQREGVSVGWVGFLAQSKGKYNKSQDKTIHVNLDGTACTFSASGWLQRMADYVDQSQALITRTDLALDFHDGIKGGIARFLDEYKAGLMDHLGHRPKHKLDGSWLCGEGIKNEGRSLYLGSRASGKFTNIYEKGKQLFGADDPSEWLRVELRYGNQKRVIPSDILRRPSDFFAGASSWHASVLQEHGRIAQPQTIKQTEKLQQQTLEAEVKRNVKWFFSTAGRSACLAFLHLPEKIMGDFLEQTYALPGRLAKFTHKEVASCYERVFISAKDGQIGVAV